MGSIRTNGLFLTTITPSMILFSIQFTLINLIPTIISAAVLSTVTRTILITFTLTTRITFTPIIVGLSGLETGVFAAFEMGVAVIQQHLQHLDPGQIAVCDEESLSERKFLLNLRFNVI